MASFAQYLQQQKVEAVLVDVLLTLVGVLPQVEATIRGGEEGYHGTENVYGEKQLKLDVMSNELFVSALQKNQHVASIASEELENELQGNAQVDATGEAGATDAQNIYSVAFDPLDGSSLVDSNLSIGSIVGVYKGKGFVGRKGSEQVAALIAVYGPRLTFMISVGGDVVEFLYDEKEKDFVLSKHDIHLADGLKMFAPGNLRACSSEDWYIRLLEYWSLNGYTLRYSGGMVPDVNQILRKGGGIFTYPGYKEKPEGKLRLLYECAPIAYLIEKAGGSAVIKKDDGSIVRILDLSLEKLDQRTPIFLGSKKEVDLVMTFIK